MTLAADTEGAVWARSAFRLRGSLVPRNGRATICAIGRDAETSPGRRGVGQEGGPLLHPRRSWLRTDPCVRPTPKEHDKLLDPAKEAAMAPDFMMKVVGEHAPARGLPVKHPLMHRTRTVDYAIIMAGEIDMMLDDALRRGNAGF